MPEDHKSHFIHNDIIGRKKLVKCGLVITSRPAASTHFHNRVNCRAEVLGFTKEDRKYYIEDALLEMPDKIKQLDGFLKSNPILDSLCYIPLNMTILLCLAEEGVTNLPKTQTDLFQRFIIMTIIHFLKKEKVKVCATNLSSLDDFPSPQTEVIKELSEFAFVALQRDKLVFTLSEVKAACPNVTPYNWYGYGLLKPVQYFQLKDSCNYEHESFHFVHFSIQEYMAAYHIASLPKQNLLSLLNEKFWNFRFINAWIMYVGITGGKDPVFKDFLSQKSYLYYLSGGLFGSSYLSTAIQQDKIKCLHLLHCLAETEHDLLSSVESIFKDDIIDLSHQTMSPHNIRTLAVLLQRSHSKQWKKLDLSHCNLNKTSCDILWKMCSSQSIEINVNIVDVSYNCNLHWESLNVLTSLLKHWHTKELVLPVNSLLDSKTSYLVHNFDQKLREKFYRPVVPLLPQVKLHADDKEVWKIIYINEEHNAVVVKLSEKFVLYKFPLNFFMHKGEIKVYLIRKLKLDDCLALYIGGLNTCTHIEFSFITEQYYKRIASTLSDSSLKLRFTGCCVNANYLVDMLNNMSSNIMVCKATQRTSLEKNLMFVNAGTIAMKLCNKISSLVDLSLDECKITMESAEELAMHLLTNFGLRYLKLNDNNLETEGLIKIAKGLRNTSSLEHLEIMDNKINGKAAEAIALVLSHNHKLKLLILFRASMENEDALKIAKGLLTISSLQFLSMAYNSISIQAADSLAAVLSHNTKLSTLNLCRTNLQSSGAIKIMNGLKCVTSLVSLQLEENNIDNTAASDIANALSVNMNLQDLCLGQNNLQSEGIIEIAKVLQHMKSLVNLTLNKNNMGNDAAGELATALSSLTKLKRLNLSDNQLFGEGIAKLTKGLQHIPKFLAAIRLGKYVNLMLFNMENNGIGDVTASEIAIFLSQMPKLISLNLGSNNLLNEGVIKIAKALIQKKINLQELNLSNNGIDSKAADDIAAVLACSPNLRSLNLNVNKLQAEGAIKISKSLKQALCLSIFNMKENDISSEAASGIAEALSDKFGLHQIDLGKNNLQTEGALEIIKSLQNVSFLRVLNMGGNSIGDEVTDEIALLIARNINLMQLDLSHNNLHSDGGLKIAKSLQNISSLRALILKSNKIGDETADEFAYAICKNTQLMTLDFSNNTFGNDGAERIAKAMQNVPAFNTVKDKIGAVINGTLNSTTIEMVVIFDDTLNDIAFARFVYEIVSI